MARVILYIATSLDGYIADKEGKVDWLFHDADYGYKSFYDGVGQLLMGRTTYDQVLGFGDWPYAGKKTTVLTHRQAQPKQNVEFREGKVSEIVPELCSATEGHLWLVGGAQLVAELQHGGLIDEYIISQHPIILGQGISLFEHEQSFDRTKLSLSSVQKFDSGLVQLHYVRGA